MPYFAKLKGAGAIVQFLNFRLVALLAFVVSSLFVVSCGGAGGNGPEEPNGTAATVNGQAIKMEDVERAVKQQAQGQEVNLSPLELASARLQVLQTLIQQEVMFQKAQKEGTVPTDEEITAEINKQKTQSGKSADAIDKEMKDAGMTDAALRDQVKKQLAIQKLVDKLTGKIEPPKDAEIDAFYNGNKDAFVKKRGVKLAAIVIDPANSGEGDTTVDDQSSVLRANDIIKRLQAGTDFSTLAQQYSEDQSKLQNGELGYIAEDDMKQSFPEQLTATLMNPQTDIGKIFTTRMQGKLYILKLQERIDRDEALTLDSPGVRQQVTDQLVNSRKQLLSASYQAIAMNEARVENYLAKKVVDNPNELSGARPAPVGTAASTNPTGSVTTPTPAAENTNANAVVKPVTNTNTVAKPVITPAAKPAATTPAKPVGNANR
ncbi:MAG TPA: SurA N-terminal domain-containing protein [Pyrinomonadaceae bacterium]|jgi:parvulin-like peptidyl-prolyl isomerase